MELDGIEQAVRNVANAPSFLPSWAVSDIILILTILVSLGVLSLVTRLARRAASRRPFLAAMLARMRGPLRLAGPARPPWRRRRSASTHCWQIG